MPNLKFSQFQEQTDPANVQFVVGYNGTDNVRIAPGNLGGGYPFLIDTQSLYSGFVPAGLSGNPQGNTVLGISAGNSLTSARDNTLIGDSAGKSISNNVLQSVMVGAHAGEFKNIGSQSVLLGYRAGQNSSGGVTVLIGLDAGRFSTAGNTIAIGDNAARSNQSITHLSIGSTAGYSNTTGEGNTNIGHLTGSSLTTGSNNTNLGYRAGSDVTGNNNVLLGFQAGTTSGAWNNTIIIGHNGATSPVGQSNFIVLGNSSHTTLQIPGIQSGATDGDVLTYNATLGKLELQTPSAGGATSLNGLSDVSIDTTNDNSFLINIPSGLTSGALGNLAIGQNAANSLTSGDYNVILGSDAMKNATYPENCVAIGYKAAESATYRWGYVAIGSQAAQDNTNNITYGTFVGWQAGKGNGVNNAGATVIGMQAGLISAGENTVAVGRGSGRSNTAAGTTSVGYQAGFSNTTGTGNVNIGYDAGHNNTTGASRVMVGYEAGRRNTGSNNVFLGKATGKGVGSGSQTIAIGQGVMESGSAANNSVFIGNYMAANTTSGADSTVAIGANCLSVSGYSGEANVVVGFQAADNLTSGDNNTLIGRSAGKGLSTQSNSTFVGFEAGRNSFSEFSTALGSKALYGSYGSSTGNQNTAVGYQAGDSITSGSNLTVIGYDADASSATATNEITLGNASVTALRIPGLQSGASDGDVLTFASGTGLITLQAAGGGGGASDLNGLSDCLVDTDSLYVGEVPSGLSGNPQDNTVLGIDAGASITSANACTIIGSNAGNLITTGNRQTIVGHDAGSSITTSGSNTIFGYEAGKGISGFSDRNVVVGDMACRTSAGDDNVAIGSSAGYSWNNAVEDAVAIGSFASSSSNGGSGMVAIGRKSARTNSAAGHISIGFEAGYSQTSGTKNTNLGYEAGYSTTTGNSNVYVGYEAGQGSTTGFKNVAVGVNALDTVANKFVNTAVGYQAGKYVVSNANTFVGADAGRGDSNGATGGANTVLGSSAYNLFTSGSGNTVLGYQCLINGTHTGSNNVFVGRDILLNTSFSGSNSIAIGYQAAPSSASASNEITLGNASVTSFRIPGIQSGASDGDVLTFNSSAGKLELQAAGGGGASDLNGLSDCVTSATGNTFLGNVPSGLNTTNAIENVVIGIDAGNNWTSQDGSTVIGYKSFENYAQSYTTSVGTRTGRNVNGQSNTFFGYEAGEAFGVSSTNARQNVCIGYRAGQMIRGTSWPGPYAQSNTYVGFYAGRFMSSITGTNQIVIGAQAGPSTGSVNNEITLGDSNIAALRCAVTSITSLSDERDKSNIKDLEYGLAFIDALQPREFVWDNRPEKTIETDEDGNETEVEFYSDNKGKKDFGFIAQEVQELDNETLRLVYSENEEKLELSYGKLVPILVKAIQELKEEVEILKSQNK